MEKKEKHKYLNDKYVTSILLRDMKEKKVSDELAEIFIKIQSGVLKRPNFAGYYAGLKEAMQSEGTYLFLSHWYKFKPYRVRNNYRVKEKGNYLLEDGTHKSKNLITNKCFKKFDMFLIDGRTYTIANCKEKEGKYIITLFNKLKNKISKDTEIVHLIPKVDLFNSNGQISGGFTFLTTFAFTGAKNKITHYKKEQEKMQEMIERYNDDVYVSLHTQDIDAEGYANRKIGDLF